MQPSRQALRRAAGGGRGGVPYTVGHCNGIDLTSVGWDQAYTVAHVG